MNDKYRGEQILVFDRSLLEDIGMFQGITSNPNDYLKPILDKSNNRFHLRVTAEEDPSLQQIIPYVVFVHEDTVFSYVRGKQAGESRLIGNRSIGIGGHINPEDETLFAGAQIATDHEHYMHAVMREISEEVIVEGPFDPIATACIKDESNPVGCVHFGVVHVCHLDAPVVKKREQQITQAGFIPIKDLAGPRREELESWSALCVDMLLAQ